MDQIKKIQCPSCGANSVFKLNATEYKCNYCQTNFLISSVKPATPSDVVEKYMKLKEMKAAGIPLNPAAKKIGCVIAVAIIVFLIGIGAAIFFSVKQTVSNFSDDKWQPASLNKYVAFSGSKSSVVWEIIEYTGKKLDSARHELLVIDPITTNVLSDVPLGETTSWKENFNFNKKLSHEFFLLNDTVYNGSEDGGLQAFDLYTGRVLLTNRDFEQKFPELKDGITKVESRLYNNQYVFYTNTGDEYYYYPAKNLLKTKKQEDDSYKTDTVTRADFYLSEGKKPSLYLITQKESRNERGVIYDNYLKGYEEGDKYYRKQFHSLVKLGDKVYPSAQRLISTSDFAVLAYLSDFSKKPQVIVEKIDATGKSVWQNHDTSFTALINNFSSDNLNLNYNNSKSGLVFYNTSSINRSVGIDLLTGKTIFVHSQGYNLD